MKCVWTIESVKDSGPLYYINISCGWLTTFNKEETDHLFAGNQNGYRYCPFCGRKILLKNL